MPSGTLATIWSPQIDSAAPLACCSCVSPTQRHRKQSRAPCGKGLSGDEGVGLAVMLAPFRMSDDDGARSGVF